MKTPISILALVLTASAALAQWEDEPIKPAPAHANMEAILEAVPADHAARYERFKDFYIKGVCGTWDFERLASMGVNTMRGYTIATDGSTAAILDEAHANGMKVVLSEWMPDQGENAGREGGKWTFDYASQGEALLGRFIKKVEDLGDHPAILMWGLGNEVDPTPEYLRIVNQMSEAVHERHPDHLTSLTMVNARPEAIEAIKRYAPDIDVLGVQSYSAGAVRNSIRKMEELWSKPFYLSEFNARGPWNFSTTGWDESYDHLGPAKAREVQACYEAIHNSPLCLGSTIFTWGHFRVNRPTYFSLLLNENPDAPTSADDSMITPQAEVMATVFGGQMPGGNRPPLLTKLETTGGGTEIHVAPGETFQVMLAGEDPDGGSPRLFCRLLDTSRRRSWAAGGTIEAGPGGVVEITAPNKDGTYLIMAYAADGEGGASASTMPLLVGDTETGE